MVNSKPRDMKLFQKMSRYIMQEDLLQPSLTVMESMKISADLKLGHTITDDIKVDSVIDGTRVHTHNIYIMIIIIIITIEYYRMLCTVVF